MAGRRQHIHDALAELDLRSAIRPIAEVKMAGHLLERRTHNLRAGVAAELSVSRAVIQVTVGMHHGKREARLRQQRAHRLRERHLACIANRPRVDQQCALGPEEKVQKGSFVGRAQALPQDEGLRVVAVHLQWRLRILLTIARAPAPFDIQ